MRRYIVATTLLLCCSLIAAAETPTPRHTLVINDSGHYLMQIPQSGTPSFIKIDVVIDVRTGGTNPTPPTDPSPERPDAKKVRELVETLAAANPTVNVRQDAAELSATYKFLLDNLNPEDPKFFDRVKSLRNIAAAGLDADWSDVFKELDVLLVNSGDPKTTLKDIADGLTNYVNTSAQKALENGEQPEEINIDAIQELLRLLLLFLQLLSQGF